MTVQVGDIYKVNKETYICLETSNGDLFNPRFYGFRPEGVSTDCIIGYWCEFEIADERLKLQKLHIHDKNDYYPTINGVSISATEYVDALKVEDEGLIPTKIPRYWGYQTYEHLELVIPYTGMILLAKDLVDDYLFPSFCPKPYEYKKLLSFEFNKGIVKRSEDHSKTARLIRDMLRSDRALRHKRELDIYRALPLEIRETLWWYEIVESDQPFF